MNILFVPILYTILVLLALLLALLRYWRMACILALLALIANWQGAVCPLHPVSGLYWKQSHGEAEQEQSLRLLTYNAFGRGPYFEPRGKDPQGAAGLEAWLRSYQPDVILLEEFQQDILPVITDTLAAHFPHSTWDPTSHRSLGHGEDLALSRYPIHQVQTIEVPMPDSIRIANRYTRPVIQSFHVDTPRGEILVVQCHLKSNGYTEIRSRMAQDTTQVRWLDGWEDYMRGIRNSYLLRPYEARAIVRHVVEVEQWEGPVIVAGDLNDLSGSETLEILQHQLHLRDAWWEGGLGYGFTYDAHHMLLRLDHVLYSRHFEVQQIRVDREVPYSDHRPIITDLQYR